MRRGEKRRVVVKIAYMNRKLNWLFVEAVCEEESSSLAEGKRRGARHD